MSSRAKIAILAVVAGIVFFLFSDPFLSPPDCACYWAWGQSFVRDFDFGFLNDFSQFDMPARYTYVTTTDRLANDWPPGSGLLIGPWVLAGRIIAHAWVVLLVAAALAMWMRAAQLSKSSVAWGIVAVLLGTPLTFYVLFGPFFSHAVSFAVTTAFLVLWSRTRDSRTTRETMMLGLLLGIATVVRPQNALLGIVFIVEIIGSRGRAINPRALGAFVAGGLIGVAPLLCIYWSMYGTPLALPKTEEMHWLNPALGKVLTSDFHGMLPWTPAYAIGIVGLIALARRDRLLGIALALVFLSQLYVNAANVVWWAGGSFGNRRLVDSAIVVAWGVAAMMEQSAPRPRARWTLTILLGLCCAWTLWLMLAERRLLVPLDHYVPFFDSEFPKLLAGVARAPLETWEAIARGPWTGATALQRTLGALLVGSGLFAAATVATRLRRAHISRIAPATVAFFALFAIAVAGAALRTPRVDDPEIERIAGDHARILWDNYIELAYYELVRNDFAASEDAAQRAVDLWDGHYSGWLALGRAQFYQGKFESALHAFEKAHALAPDNPTSRDMLNQTRGRLGLPPV